MNEYKEIVKSRKKMRKLMIKQESIFNNLLDKIGVKEPENISMADKIFDYLYNGTSYSLSLIKQELNNNKSKKSWWHRK